MLIQLQPSHDGADSSRVDARRTLLLPEISIRAGAELDSQAGAARGRGTVCSRFILTIENADLRNRRAIRTCNGELFRSSLEAGAAVLTRIALRIASTSQQENNMPLSYLSFQVGKRK